MIPIQRRETDEGGDREDEQIPTTSTKLQPELTIIREIYDVENCNDKYACELESALASAAKTIIIEPAGLGDETARWISVGNCLYKTSVLTGVAGIICAFVWPDRPVVYLPISFLSYISTGIYVVSWQGDPCSKYQVDSNPTNLSRLRGLKSSPPVVLIRYDDSRRKAVQTAVTLTSIIVAFLTLYRTS